MNKINAKQANELAKQFEKTCDGILNQIEKEAKLGKYKLKLSYTILPATEEALLERGFKVNSSYQFNFTEITWNNE